MFWLLSEDVIIHTGNGVKPRELLEAKNFYQSSIRQFCLDHIKYYIYILNNYLPKLKTSNMKKKLLFLLFTLWWAIHLKAQSTSPEILSSAGETTQSSSISLDWTLGELAITTIENSNLQVTQGFHQPNYTITSLNNLPETLGQVEVFPNPSSDWVNMNFTFFQDRQVEAQLVNVGGNVIWSKRIEGQQISEKVSLKQLPSGTYILKFIIDEKQFVQSNKILKIN